MNDGDAPAAAHCCQAKATKDLATLSPPLPNPLRATRRLPDIARRKAGDEYRYLKRAREADFDNIAMLAAHICEASYAAIAFADGGGQWFKAQIGIGEHETALVAALCANVPAGEAMVIEDVGGDARFAGDPRSSDVPKIRFFAGVRAAGRKGTSMPSLCVFDVRPRRHGLTELQMTALRVRASQVQSLGQLHRSVIEQQDKLVAQSVRSKDLQYLAEHDPLTGLPNRTLFHQRLLDAMRVAARDNTRVALMLIDVDHFKQINDSLGHDVGDALPRGFAGRFRSVMRSTDVVARLGGDEFGVVLPADHDDNEIAMVVRSLSGLLTEPLHHNGRLVDCHASMGLAFYPEHAGTTERLMKCSDLALAVAKTSRGSAVTFQPDMADEFERDTEMLAIARAGIAENRIVPHYQPQVSLDTGVIVGFEALVRCEQAGRRTITPDMFAKAFGDRRLAVAMSQQMLTKFLDDMRCWIDKGVPFGHIATNTCAADFQPGDFAERLLCGAGERSLPVNLIEVEVTEGVFLGRGSHNVARALSLLSEHGVRIALDDFGTGYASLTHLKQFPVDVLKIDRSFVAGIGKDPDDTAIVRFVIGLGKSLGIVTNAEGVETEAQAEFLTAHGYDIGQDFLYGTAEPRQIVPDICRALR